MRLPALSLQHYRFTVVAILLLAAYGVLGYVSMPRQEDPVVEPKSCGIVVIYPGASPEDIEDLVVDPLEDHVAEIDDVLHISSTSRDGMASLVIEFAADADMEEMLIVVREQLAEAEAEFPEGVLESEVIKHTTARVVALQIAVTSTGYPYPRLKDFAEEVKREMQRIPEVKRVELEGAQQEEIRISVDAGRLSQYGISLLQVVERLTAENTNIPSGKIDVDPRKFNVRVSGQFEGIEDIETAIVAAPAGKPIYLKDVAQIQRRIKEPSYVTRFNGKRAIFVTVMQKEGTNILTLGKKAERALQELRVRLSDEVGLDVVFHQPGQVAQRLHDFQSNLLIGAGIVGLLVLALMGLRMSLIVITAIPLSIVIAFGWMHAAGIALHQISISALVIVLGMLVDNAIVVSANIRRFIQAGKPKLEAIGEGASQVGWPVSSATMTTIAAFIPLVLMTGETGQFIRAIPYTVSLSLLASLLVAMTVTPLLCYRGLKGTIREGIVVGAMRRFIDRTYTAFLRRALRRKAVVLGSAIVAFVGSLFLFPFLGVQFFPKAERAQFLIDIEMPEGHALGATDRMARSVEEVLSEEPSVLSFATNVGKGNPTTYYNILRHNEAVNYAQILVNLRRDGDAPRAAEVIEKLRQALGNIMDVRIEMREFEQGPPIGAPVAVRISGDKISVLKHLSREVEARLARIKGAVNVNSDLEAGGADLQVRVHKDKARLLGLPNHLIARTVRAAISGEVATTYREKDESLDVVVALAHHGGEGTSALDQIYLPSLSGAQVPLRQVAEVGLAGEYALIVRRDRERTATVRADLQGRLADQVLADLKESLRGFHLPEGYSIVFGGETEKRDEPFRALFRALIIAIIAIYGILVLQFNSFLQPLIILAAMPLAFIGAIAALLITGNHFGFMAFVGGVSLAGVVVNNAIVLIDYANRLRKTGMPIREVVVQAGQVRFIPVILTTITTIGGLLPLTVRGGTLWAPMGWTIIGGLALSTVLTLVIVPVLYSMMGEPASGSSDKG